MIRTFPEPTAVRLRGLTERTRDPEIKRALLAAAEYRQAVTVIYGICNDAAYPVHRDAREAISRECQKVLFPKVERPCSNPCRVGEGASGIDAWWRASHEALCVHCEKTYLEHPRCTGTDWLTVLCDGSHVKL